MENKLGLDEEQIILVEHNIIKIKLEILDEYFTFNSFDIFDYLKKLNLFLFEDLYHFHNSNTRDLNEIEIKKINYLLSQIKIKASNKDYKSLEDLFLDLYRLQVFKIGNRRTLIGFLKVINNSYDLGLKIDLSQDFSDNYNFFSIISKQSLK